MYKQRSISKSTAKGLDVYKDVDELAKDLGIGRQTAYTALRDGTIPSIRMGKRFIIPRSAVGKWLLEAYRPSL